MDALEIDEGVPESAVRTINRRRPRLQMNDGVDGSRSKTPEMFKVKPMQKEFGRLLKKVPRRHHGHVNRGIRLLRPASSQEQKGKR